MIQPIPLWFGLLFMQFKYMAKIKSLNLSRKNIEKTPELHWNMKLEKRAFKTPWTKIKPWTISTHSILKYFLMSKMSTWIHPMLCSVTGLKTLMHAQVFGDFTITEIDMIERKPKKKIYDLSLYNGVSGQIYNFFPKPHFSLSVSFYFFWHC